MSPFLGGTFQLTDEPSQTIQRIQHQKRHFRLRRDIEPLLTTTKTHRSNTSIFLQPLYRWVTWKYRSTLSYRHISKSVSCVIRYISVFLLNSCLRNDYQHGVRRFRLYHSISPCVTHPVSPVMEWTQPCPPESVWGGFFLNDRLILSNRQTLLSLSSSDRLRTDPFKLPTAFECAFGTAFACCLGGGLGVGLRHCARLTISPWMLDSACTTLHSAFWFSVISFRTNSTSSWIRLFSLLLACRCCRRTSSSFWDRWIASSWGIDSVVAMGTLDMEVRRVLGRFTVFRLDTKLPARPKAKFKIK